MAASAKHRRWFDRGAGTFRAVANAHGWCLPDEPVYPCPLCQRLCTKADLDAQPRRLTAEDVPPLSVGGRKIVLTCARCNNEQGSRIDSHAKTRERWVDSMTGVRVTPFQGTHTVGESTANVEIWAGPNSLLIGYVPSQNNPHDHEAYLQALDDLPEDGTHRVTMRGRFTHATADLSYARAAFLASFAVFGWSHIFRPAFVPLRRRLVLASDDPLPKSLVRYNPERSVTERGFLLVTEPGPQHGALIIGIGRATVVFPGPQDRRSLDEVASVFAELVQNGGEGRFSGDLYDWPTEPQHRRDPRPGRIT